MVIASGSACGGASSKLRRSRRLSSTRGLKRVVEEGAGRSKEVETRKTAAMNWELNERISLSSGSSPGLAVRADARRGIELSGSRKKVDAWSWRGRVETGLELMNVSGFQQGEQDKRRGKDTLEEKKGAVIKSDSKYEIGVPGSDPGSSGKWSKQRRQQVSSGGGGSSKSRKSKSEKEGEKGERKWVGGRKKTEKTNDSISKRLELIHELNQKILANYERFQQRSRSKNHSAKEGKCDGWKKEQGRSRGSGKEEEDAEAKRKGSRGAKPAQRSCDRDCSRRMDQVSTKKQSASSPSSCSSSKSRTLRDNENFIMAARPGLCGAEDKEEAEHRGGEWKDSDRLGSSRLYPERYDSEGISRAGDEAKVERGGARDEERVGDRLAIEEVPRDVRGCERTVERWLDGEGGKKEEVEEEAAWDEKRRKTATGKKKKRREKSGSEGAMDSSGGCSATSGEAMSGPKVARLQETFNSSWDSGVGVDVGNGGSGWVRIHTGIESSLVYLTVDTTARDVCRDMLLGDDLSLFIQVSGPPTSVANYSFDLRRKGCARPPRLMRGTNMLMRNCCSHSRLCDDGTEDVFQTFSLLSFLFFFSSLFLPLLSSQPSVRFEVRKLISSNGFFFLLR